MKILIFVIGLVLGFFSPNIVSTVTNAINDSQRVIIVQDKDELRREFYNNPSKENWDELCGAIPYQVNTLGQYDLFANIWYVAFQYDDYSARYTLHLMLTDTILDDNHYIPNSNMMEFAQTIKSKRKQTE